MRAPTPKQARAKAEAWAKQGGPDGRLNPADCPAFIKTWTERFLEMDHEEFSSTGPALVPVRRGPPLRKHPDDMTNVEMRAAFDDRPWLWQHDGDGGHSLNVDAGREALRAEWEMAHGAA